MYSGWVFKPKAERGVRGVPEKTRQCPRPVSDEERKLLLDCLLGILNQRFDTIKTPKNHRLGSKDTKVPIGGQGQEAIDSSPIPFAWPQPKNEAKRPRELLIDQDGTFKKPRRPAQAPDIPATSFNTSRSAQTSFASYQSTIFSNPQLNTSNRSLPEVFSQETIPTQRSEKIKRDFDMEAYRDKSNISFQSNTQSSEYDGASSFDADLVAQLDTRFVGISQSDPIIDDELSQDVLDQAAIIDEDADELIIGEDELRQRLKRVFPELPRSLRGVPFRAAYEIVRIFLHAGFSLEDAQAPSAFEWQNYDKLWQWLKGHPLLRTKPFPRRSSQEAWDIAGEDGFQKGTRAVYISGSLRFNSEPSGPLFLLRLKPLELNKSHRTGRRFGHDRLFEVDIPSLVGQHVPKILRQLASSINEIVLEWLVNERHQFLDKTWQSFNLKPLDHRKKTESKDVLALSHRIFLFAVDGTGFRRGAFPTNAMTKPYVKISIESLLNSIRPTRKNVDQSYLKLFVRTSLALSRNVATVILEKHQIMYKRDIKSGEDVMTDGGGRISPSLAFKVKKKLGLTYQPSGFQARIGNAKGFWSICPNDFSQEDWLEIYESQCKWTPSTRMAGESDDPSHRTFEVLAHSKPLRSAKLNLQLLPLLVNGANDPVAMRGAVAGLLENGLACEILTLQAAMENVQSFRKWVHEICPRTRERLKNRGVSFVAGLPDSREERLIVLLTAGFDAKKLMFMKEMTKSVFHDQFKDLQARLNITIGKSTNVYMIPDFAGVLDEGEIYIDFSHPVDETSEFPGYSLNGVAALVARNPAHLVSDIQKVRVVFKVELIGLKDVVVFSTKGRCLADKLSGGDYDGDRAWLCWEPSIVNNFTSVDVPTLPDLVKEGFLRKDSTTYEDLVRDQPKPVSTFLKKAFSFAMQPSFLGICTSHKNAICYDVGRVDTEDVAALSALVNLIVDASKQGLIFTEEDWARFKAEKIKTVPRRLRPEEKDLLASRNADHIFDYLKWVARETIDSALTKFHQGLPDPPTWDEDLAAHYHRARDLAQHEPQWAKLLDDLKADIKLIENANRQRRNVPEHLRSPWTSYIGEAYADFLAIVPHEVSLVSRTILLDSPTDGELSSWALLKASTMFASYGKYVSNFAWYLLGKQLCLLKAKATGGMFAVVPSMYAMLKPDNQYVKALLSEEPLISFGDDELLQTVEEDMID